MQAPPTLVTIIAAAFVILGLVASIWPSFVKRLNSRLFDSFGLENHARKARFRSQVIQARIAGIIMLLLGLYLTGVTLGVIP